jgi:hypothetical protein
MQEFTWFYRTKNLGFIIVRVNHTNKAVYEYLTSQRSTNVGAG